MLQMQGIFIMMAWIFGLHGQLSIKEIEFGLSSQRTLTSRLL